MDLSLGAVFAAGLLTFLSPCVLPVVPVYLAILGVPGESGGVPRWRPLLSTLIFSLGFALVFSLLGLSASAVGRLLIRNKMLFQQVAGLVVLLLGLRFMGYLRLPSFLESGGSRLGGVRTRFHYLNVFVLGLLFAFAWTPCVGSVLGAVLTYTSLRTTHPLEGMAWLGVYSLGFATPLVIGSAFAGPALRVVARAKRLLPVFEKGTGALLVAGGFLLVTDQWGLLDSAFTREPEPAPAVATAHPADAPADAGTCSSEPGAGTCGIAEVSSAVLLKFYSPTCPICLQMVPVVNALRNECLGKNLVIRDVNVATPEGRALAREHGVTGVPAFLFLDAERREVARLLGYQPLASLEQAASIAIGEECPAFRRVPNLGP